MTNICFTVQELPIQHHSPAGLRLFAPARNPLGPTPSAHFLFSGPPVGTVVVALAVVVVALHSDCSSGRLPTDSLSN